MPFYKSSGGELEPKYSTRLGPRILRAWVTDLAGEWFRDFAWVSESESVYHIRKKRPFPVHRLNAEPREGNHTQVTKLFWLPFNTPAESCFRRYSVQVQIFAS